MILFTLLIIATSISYAATPWYSINWIPGNEWLNNNSQQITWTGMSNKYAAHFGVQRTTSIPPPSGQTYDKDLTLVITSEPQLSEYRITKIGEIDKYFRSYITLQNVNGLEIDSPDESQYIPIKLKGWQYWGGNVFFNTRNNNPIFPSDSGFNGIYATYYRFRLYPTDFLLDDDYILLDETLHFSLKYWENSTWIATALQVTPYASFVDVLSLRQNNDELTVGSVEFFSDDSSGGNTYKLHIEPGEVGSTQFAFHRSGGGSTIPYRVKIENSTQPSSNSYLERVVTTRNANNHWHDFIELTILGFTPNQTYDNGNYSSIIKISLTVN